MNAKLIITEYQNQIMGFLFENNTLYEVHSFDENCTIGNIYVARVENIVENIDAAFLSIDGTESCYYSLKENQKRHIVLNPKKKDCISEGDLLLVQVSREPAKKKKGEVTANLTLTGKYVVINRTGVVGISSKIKDEEKREELKTLVSETILSNSDDRLQNYGAIVRTESVNASSEEIKKETVKLLCKLNAIIDQARYRKEYSLLEKNGSGYQHLIQNNLVSSYDSFEVVTDIESVYNDLKDDISCNIVLYQDKLTNLLNVYRIEKQLETALARRVYLKSGAYLVVDVTEALTVIDVNTGKSVHGKNRAEHILKINKEAAQKVSEILRIRNLSGIIIIDFINMESQKDIAELISYLKHEISYDKVKTTFVDLTALGLVELTRKKVRKPLYEIINE